MEFEEFKSLVRPAMEEARKQGWRILPGRSKDSDEKRCCPAMAVSILKNVNADTLFCLADVFEIDSDKLYAFACGFDGATPIEPYLQQPDWLNFGKEIRNEVINSGG